MTGEQSHPSEEALLLYADGELAPGAEKIAAHVAGCATCEARVSELKRSLADLAFVQRQAPIAESSTDQNARAALISRMAEQRAMIAPPLSAAAWRAYAAAAAVLIAVVLLAVYRREANVRAQFSASLASWTEPRLTLTPGATLPVTQQQICSSSSDEHQRVVPVSLQREVFAMYGMDKVSANYEVDYLITPELGGATDVRNLWPEPYYETAWNAHVKDQLEDRLHEMVCRGDLDLATAQKDISRDWIAAYRKYFHTDAPLAESSLKQL